MQKGDGARWEQNRKEEKLFFFFLKKVILKKTPHAVKKPYHMEQITCHKQKRNRKERQMDKPG